MRCQSTPKTQNCHFPTRYFSIQSIDVSVQRFTFQNLTIQYFCLRSMIEEWLEREPSNSRVQGSNPARVTLPKYLAYLILYLIKICLEWDSNLGPNRLSLLEFETWQIRPWGHHGWSPFLLLRLDLLHVTTHKK